MGSLAEVDWKSLAMEANVRALLEDLVEAYRTNPLVHWALAVWFEKPPQSHEHNLLALLQGFPTNEIQVERRPLVWKADLAESPIVNIHMTTVDYFAGQLTANRHSLDRYFDRSEVLYFDKTLLPAEVLRAFNVITEPSGLIKGWYVSADEYDRSNKTVRSLLSMRGYRPTLGIVKTWESPEFKTCRALVHVEVGQRWVPSSPAGITSSSFYSDWQGGHPGHFLFQGGALYRILKFEVKHAPQFSALVLEPLHDDRYPEVYLRAVYPPEQPAA